MKDELTIRQAPQAVSQVVVAGDCFIGVRDIGYFHLSADAAGTVRLAPGNGGESEKVYEIGLSSVESVSVHMMPSFNPGLCLAFSSQPSPSAKKDFIATFWNFTNGIPLTATPTAFDMNEIWGDPNGGIKPPVKIPPNSRYFRAYLYGITVPADCCLDFGNPSANALARNRNRMLAICNFFGRQ